MQIRRYETANLKDALAKIKKELGPDAIILSTKKIPGDKSLIEVMAARDSGREAAAVNNFPAPAPADRSDGSLSALSEEIRGLRSCIDALTLKMASANDLSELKETMNVLFDRIYTGKTPHLHDMYKRLVAIGVSRTKAVLLTEAVRNNVPQEGAGTFERGNVFLEKLIARSLPRDNKKERRIKAVIGPTGVGKTTTLAKLAAHYSLEKKMKVGLITTDTYRIAAADQLKVYAKIMGLPLEVASEKARFDRSLENLSEKDVILVDTPGRNHNDGQALRMLKDILGPDTENILLISSVAGRESLSETADRFKLFDYSHIILTKLDECSRFGSLYDVLDEIGKPVSYMTTGQSVPKDIEKASPERLARLIIQNRLN
jgi:flagellar biosynthesis protein FlhF